MKGRLRKLLSVLLVFCLMAAGAPAGTNTAWAGGTVGVTTEGELRSSVADTAYSEVSIDGDITLTDYLTINRDVTLTSASGATLNAGTKTITIAGGTDVTLQGNIAITGSGNPVIEVASGAGLTLEDDASVTQTGSAMMMDAIRNTGGDIEIAGGSVTSSYTGLNNQNGKLTVSDGVITGAENAVESYYWLKVTGGAIGSTSGSKQGIRVMAGTAFIEEGSVSALQYAVFVGSTGRAHITGGTFTASAAEYFAFSCSSDATLIGGSFTGRVATSGTGTIDIAPGSSGLSLSDGVRYSVGGQYRYYLTELPAVLPLVAKVGVPTNCTPVGADYGVTFELNGEAHDYLLGVVSLGNQVTMEPTTTGDYSLTLIAKDLKDGNGQTLKLILPVTVSAADADLSVTIQAIPGLTPPATGGTPVTTVATVQYTGGITWSPAVSGSFAPNTQYTATIVLGSMPGFTLAEVTEDFFTVDGATTVTNPAAGSTLIMVTVTAVFPATGAAPAAKLATPGNLRWDNTTTPGTVEAKWNAVPEASYYLVTLYHNGMLKSSTNPTGTSTDFTSSMRAFGLGSYTFTVQAIAPAVGEFSNSDVSEPSSPYTYTPVCMTSGDYWYYDSLDAALAAVPTGGAEAITINLLDDISHDGLVIDNKNVAINPSGKVLTLGKDSEFTAGLAVKNGGKFTMSPYSTGAVNAVSKGTAVMAEGTDSHAMVYNATSTNDLAAYAQTGGKITVKNDAVGKSSIRSGNSGDTATSRIDVLGGVTATDDNNNGVAVDAVAGGAVTVYKDVIAIGKGGVGVRASGVRNGNPSFPTEVILAGNVQAARIGVDASSSAQVTVNKNVTAGQGSDAHAYGVWAQDKAQVTVNGNVASNDHQDSIGAWARSTAPSMTTKITIDGTLAGKTYIKVGNDSKTELQEDDPSADPSANYHTYTAIDSNGTHAVWVKGTASPVTPVVSSVSVSPATANVQKGATQQFSATVNGTNNPGQGVMWVVDSTDSSISATGLLTVAAGETKTNLTVTATSTVDPTKSGTAAVTVTGGQTPLPTVTGIDVRTQPDKLVYTAGEVLDLDGLVVTLTYSDGDPENVDYDDFIYRSVVASPDHGTTLSVAAHHDKPVAVTCNGKTAFTNNLIVTAPAGDRQVTGIAVSTQPDKLAYTAGKALDLDGLEVTLTYSDGDTENVDYDDFIYRSVVASPDHGTTLSVAVHHDKPVAVTCNGKTAFTNNLTVTASSGGGGGGSSAPATGTSVIGDVAETAADRTLERSLTDNGNAVLSLAGGSSNTAQISAAVIARLAEHETTFAVENTGVRLDFAPGSLAAVPQVTGGALVEIGAREVTGAEREGILAQAPAGQSTGLFEIGGRIFDLTALVRTGEGAGQRIEGFGAPVAVTIDLSHLGDLTPEQIGQLTGVRLEKDDEGNIVPVILGGQYDPATRTFTFNTDTFSLYTVMRLEQAVQRLVVGLAVGSAAASVNGSPYTLDAPPLVAEGRTLVPVRFVSEALGAKVTWDAAARRITVTDAGKVIVLTLGSSQALVDGEARAIDCPPATLPPGRAFVPLRFVSETLGAQVDYDNKQITITR